MAEPIRTLSAVERAVMVRRQTAKIEADAAWNEALILATHGDPSLAVDMDTGTVIRNPQAKPHAG